MSNYKEEVINELKKVYGENATFKEDQLEAILSVLNNNKTLVVQKTGWGKSLVYFLATKILRKQNKGCSIIISPLLSLINNQIESAMNFSLNAVTINSTNSDSWSEIEKDILMDKYDVIFISPERLANEDFIQNVLYKISNCIGMLVVDEAHCISDWGHDFRPDYKRINKIIKLLPPNIPFIATTATANERVILDIKSQLGDDLVVVKGNLLRESISIQTIKLDSPSERIAWIAKNINNMPNCGIIYCLTTRDCDVLASYLQSKGIDAYSYHASLNDEDRRLREIQLINNEIKVLVATVALGMGFDKSDIGFVIHFQRPANIIAYYQQIGRAGRGIDNSYAILLYGKEDNDIINYFIDSAFPTVYEMESIIDVVKNTSVGLSINEILSKVNLKFSSVEKCLKFLVIEEILYKEKSKYYKSVNDFKPDYNSYEKISQIRKQELEDMNRFVELKSCYMEFISDILDDNNLKKCGKCSNCLNENLFPTDIDDDSVIEVEEFIKRQTLKIIPRKQWPTNCKIDGKTKIQPHHAMEEGLVLCSYGNSGYGKFVKEGKYKDEYFSDTLVDASFELLKDYVKENNIKYLTFIPSLRRPTLVSDFSRRLAKKLNLEYIECLYKKENTSEQKTMENSFMQFKNVEKGLGIKTSVNKNILLVDDMIDSKWTLTYACYLLREHGDCNVYPFALCDTSNLS